MTLRNMEWLRVAIGVLHAVAAVIVLTLGLTGAMRCDVAVAISLACGLVGLACEPWDRPKSRQLPHTNAPA